ncbi:hypothetical protein P3L10_025541 [Capsicum annuum]
MKQPQYLPVTFFFHFFPADFAEIELKPAQFDRIKVGFVVPVASELWLAPTMTKNRVNLTATTFFGDISPEIPFSPISLFSLRRRRQRQGKPDLIGGWRRTVWFGLWQRGSAGVVVAAVGSSGRLVGRRRRSSSSVGGGDREDGSGREKERDSRR